MPFFGSHISLISQTRHDPADYYRIGLERPGKNVRSHWRIPLCKMQKDVEHS